MAATTDDYRMLQEAGMRHHFLPQFYLRQWAVQEGKLFYYHRVDPKIDKVAGDRVAPKAVGFRNALYTVGPISKWQPLSESDREGFETKVMAKIDDDASKVHAKLANGVTSLTGAERHAWARFVNSLLHRHPDEMSRRDAFSRDLGEHLLRDWLARGTLPGERKRIRRAMDGINIANLATTLSRSKMVEAIDDATELGALLGMNWVLCTGPQDNPFLTTDRPVLLDRGFLPPFASSAGNGPVRVVSLPISPTRLFLAHAVDDPEWATLPPEFWSDYVDGHNLHMLAHPVTSVFTAGPATDDVPMLGTIARLRTAIDSCLLNRNNRNSFQQP